MSGADNARLIALFEQALDQPESARAAWARKACGDNPALCRQLLDLLRADADPGDPVATAIGAGIQGLGLLGDRGSIGRRFGPWRVVAELGQGGMGTVFAAERDDQEYRKRVAIKLIRGFPDQDRLQRLRAERQILADLDHPNIAGLIDGGTTDDGQPWLAIELVDGKAIDTWCADRALPLRQRLNLLIELASAVHYAHQRLVIHRDIKPGNVLVTPEGMPKLLDFGIAKLMEGSEADAAVTGMRYYTPHYSSPEQREGRPVSTLSDVYSLGKLIETVLLAGSEAAVLSREAAAIVARAAAMDPAARYPSASALAADLERWRDGQAVEALARRRAYRAWRFVMRHRLAIAALGAGLLLAALLVAQVVIERRDARLAAARAEQTLGFLTGLIESARPESAKGRDLKVADILARGDAQLERAGLSHDLRASIAMTLAGAWHALDEFPRAGDLYRRAAQEAAQSGDRAGELRARGKALVVGTRAGKVKELTPEAEQLLLEIDAWNSADAEVRADVLNDWAVWANEAGHYERARERLHQVLRWRLESGDEAEIAATENNLSLAEDRLGHLEVALTLAEQSLARKQRVLGPDHPSTLIGIRLTAWAARRVGNFERSDALLDQLLAQRIRLYGADNPVLADDYNERGNGVHDAGDFRRAIELYQRALALDALLENQPGRYVQLNNLAAAYEDRGDYAAAEPLLRESLALREQRFGEEHGYTLRARLNLARLLLRQRRHDPARGLAASTLAAYQRTMGGEHPDSRHAEWQLAWIEWSAAPSAARTPDRLIAASEAVLVDTVPTSLRGLVVRGVLARALLDEGRLDEARSRFIGLVDDYRASFGPAHPKAAELELELARIDVAEGRPAAAAERIARVRPVLQEALAPQSPALALLSCLSQPADAGCH